MFVEFVLSLVLDMLKNGVATILALVFAKVVWERVEQARFGGWMLRILMPDGSLACERGISVTKVKQILDDDADMSVYVKGVASTYGWINCDPCTVGRKNGLLTVDDKTRVMTVDLAQNPPKPKADEKKG